jgi:dolichyl-phosphooligosaccharide-protein glycotransferase
VYRGYGVKKEDEVLRASDEISIDLSKIKKWFNKDVIVGSKKEASQTIDIKKGVAFFKKYNFLLLLLIPIILSVHFRAFPIYLPATDDWARDNVYSSIKDSIRGQLGPQFPNLPPELLEERVESELQKAISNDNGAIEKQVSDISRFFRDQMQDDTGQTYLLAIDPYLWFQYAFNKVHVGHYGKSIKTEESVAELRGGRVGLPFDADAFNAENVESGVLWNDLRNGRIGKPVDTSRTNAQVSVLVYNLMHLFGSDVNVMGAVFLVPLLIVTLATIPAFFIGRKIGGNVAGVFAGIIVAINAPLLGRTPAGFSDTDAYNIFFPLLISWIFLEALDAKRKRSRLILAAFAGVLVGLFSSAWRGGWWTTFFFIIAAMGLYLVYRGVDNYQTSLKTTWSALRKDEWAKKILTIGSLFVVVAAASVSFFIGFSKFIGSAAVAENVINLKDVKVLWPNVLTTVAEFNEPPLRAIIGQMGGNLMVGIAILGILLMVFLRKDRKQKIFYAMLISIWFAGTLYAFSKGVRFSILMVPAFALAFGSGLGLAHNLLVTVGSKIRIPKYITSIVLIVLFSLLLLTPLRAANATALHEAPSMNDGWFNLLLEIRHDEADGIITSWWDFGHWFAAVAQKRVTFDGADQGKRIYWVGKSLLTNDEEHSVGMLRMLNCGQNYAFYALDGYVEDTSRSIDILNRIIREDKATARTMLAQEQLSSEQVDHVLGWTHCDNLLPQYYITSEDMVGKASVWGHFGSWDFDRAEMFNAVKKLDHTRGVNVLTGQFGQSLQDAEELYAEIQAKTGDGFIAEWPTYASGRAGCQRSGQQVQCSNGVVVDLNTMDVTLHMQGGSGKPSSVVYVDGDDVVEKKFASPATELSVMLIPDGDSFSSIIAFREQASSMFSRLFFFQGHGLKYFKRFSSTRTFNGQEVIVWKVDWEGKSTNFVR